MGCGASTRKAASYRPGAIETRKPGSANPSQDYLANPTVFNTAPVPNQEQLNDPNFVFRFCDVAGKGKLDEHEVEHALRACGVEPRAAVLGSRSYDAEEFAKLLHMLMKSKDLHSRPVVPHALRGINLEQIQQLHHIFVESGWLLGCCEKDNKEGKCQHVMRENLYAMDRYVVTPITQPGESPAREHSAGQIPAASVKCSYSELVNPHGRFVHYFVSHFWGHPFLKTVLALQLWAEMQRSLGLLAAGEVTFWICLFAINQHKAGPEVGSCPENGPFNAALNMATNGAVMIVDAELFPFRRVWCLFEVHRLFTMHTEFELISDLGPLSCRTPAQGDLANKGFLELQKNVADALQHVQAIKAEASKEEDKFRIWYSCADPTVRNLSYEDASSLKKFWDPVAFVGFDQKIQSLLANPMLRASVADKQGDAMLRWCWMGAHFGHAELDALEQQGIKPLDQICPQRGSLLVIAARTGNLQGVEALLRRSADLNATGIVVGKVFWGKEMRGTPLFWAAFQGYVDIARVLLAQNSNPNVKFEQQLATPLVVAARANHHEVVQCLLDYAADIALSTVHVPKSALHEAAAFGALNSLKLLHEANADLAHRNQGHWSPLEFASHLNNTACVEYIARFGTTAATRPDGGTCLHFAIELPANANTVKQLVVLGANLEAVTDQGATPLIHAACHGDAQGNKLQVLLEMRSNIEARDNQGATALLHASQSGRCEIISKLLDHGAHLQTTSTAAIEATLTKLVLVKKDSSARCILANCNFQQKPMDLILKSHRKSVILPLHQDPKQVGPYSFVKLGVGKSNLPVLVNYDGNSILRDADSMELHVPHGRFVEGQDLILLSGNSGDPQGFVGNGDGTISPKAAPHLVLGASWPFHVSGVLHAAVLGGHAEVAALLLKIKADPGMTDGDGSTPYDLAFEVGNVALQQLLACHAPSSLPAV